METKTSSKKSKSTINYPEISNLVSKDDTLNFRISNINVSFVNALRRTILSDIPVACFITAPYEKNNCNISINTTRLNNEILKQRLSCIPVHIDDLDIPIDNLQIEIDEVNNSSSFKYITTKDFKIKDLASDKYLTESQVQKIFPSDPKTQDYILFARLRPKLANNLTGERIKLECKFSISTAGENGSFNVVSTCAYHFADDEKKQKDEWSKIEKTIEDKSKKEINLMKKNWFNLEAKRIYKKDVFNFIMETIGIFTNRTIIKKACSIIIDKLDKVMNSITNSDSLVAPSETTIPNCFDITLVDEDYTIGKIIEYIIFELYYNKGDELCYVGFVKKHPHDSDSIIRLAFNSEDKSSKVNVKDIFRFSVEQCKNIINGVSEQI
jgi:DNA-directed RNA polymerase subunit L